MTTDERIKSGVDPVEAGHYKRRDITETGTWWGVEQMSEELYSAFM